MSWLCRIPAVRASSLSATRVQTPRRVRPPRATRVSWPLHVQMTDSTHCRTGPSEPVRFVTPVRLEEVSAEVAHELLELLASEKRRSRRRFKLGSLADFR